MAFGRSHHACIFDKTTNNVVVAGGIDAQGKYLNLTEIFSPNDETWHIGKIESSNHTILSYKSVLIQHQAVTFGKFDD